MTRTAEPPERVKSFEPAKERVPRLRDPVKPHTRRGGLRETKDKCDQIRKSVLQCRRAYSCEDGPGAAAPLRNFVILVRILLRDRESGTTSEFYVSLHKDSRYKW